MGGRRSRSLPAWRRRFVKKMKRRALKFQEEATTPEEYLAWNKVVGWCQSILDYSVLRSEGDLGLYHVSDDKIDEILDTEESKDGS